MFRFQRCLDLYLCPRVKKHRLHVRPQDILPPLPSPKVIYSIFPVQSTAWYLKITIGLKTIPKFELFEVYRSRGKLSTWSRNRLRPIPCFERFQFSQILFNHFTTLQSGQSSLHRDWSFRVGLSVDLLFTQLICCCTLLDVTAHFTSSSCGRQWLLSASEDCSIRKWEVSTLFPCEERLLSVAVYRYRQVGVSLFGAFAILSNPWLGKSILEIDFHTFFELLIVFSIERCPSQVANTFSACVASDIVLLKSTRGLGASSCNNFFLSNPKVLYIICGRP